MAYFHFKIEEGESIRLDKFLAEKLPQFSRSFLAKCALLVNAKSAKPAQKVGVGDLVEVKVPRLKELKIEPEKIPLEVLFEDSALLVVNKKSGMVVHPTDHGGHVSGTLVNAVLGHLGKKASAELRPGIVHRLDRETSGCIVIAKTAAAKTFLAREFAERRVEKIYLALAAGKIKTPRGRIDAPLGRDPADPTRRRISTAADARDAITEFEILENLVEATLLKIKLLTGRTHQIRVHLQSIGHPILGDPVYGSKKINQKFGAPRLFLHAEQLKFIHPTTKKLVEFHAPLPDDLAKFLKNLKR
ncbi:MAG: RluA family pseudouridine synthase [Patescibacteria group bacterium]